ncbi:MAG: hypothetical protein A2Y76_12225 [Planctomycetes bacterium RBG_13_60_9]|nr:MAG: hypothetical protein A2Y76_12225 [Planctomycetes bacterium RBG_13_60_9]
MCVLIANLRHFYQRRGLWIAYAGLAVIVAFLSTSTRGRGVFGGFLACTFLLGSLMGVMQMEILSKPFSFCLPNHRGSVRRLVFLGGLVASLIFLLVFAVLFESPTFTGPSELYIMPPGLLILVAVASFCASVTAFLLGAGIAFSVRNATPILGLAPVAIITCAASDIFTAIQHPVIHWPVAVMGLALVVGTTGWWWFGRPAWFRRRCGRPWIGLFDPWDRSQIQKFRDIYAARFTKNSPPGLDRFFQGVIGSHGPSDPGKYAWGALYTTSVLIAPQWKGLLTIMLFAVAMAGYSLLMAPFAISFISLMMTGLIHPPIRAALLVAGGRKERFFATVALILVFGAASVLIVGVLVGLTHLLALIVPAVTWRGVTLDLQAISLTVLAIPLAIIPIAGLIQTLFYRKPVWLALSAMLVMVIMMLFFTAPGSYQAVTPARAIGGTVLSWGICLSIMYRVAMHSDLVRQ